MRLAVAAVLAVLAATLLTACSSTSKPIPPAQAAGPQRTALTWVERYPATGPGLVFRVTSFAVTRDGWQADVAVENRSGVHWELPDAQETFRLLFGVMLFRTGDLDELERLNQGGQLPPVRRATSFVPPLVTFLGDGETWKGRISSRGAVPVGAFVRVVFGPFSAVSKPPKGMGQRVVWITDHAVELRP